MNTRTVGNYRRYQGNGGPEIKYHDSYFEEVLGAGNDNTDERYGFKLFRSVLEVPQGTQPIHRIGKKITLKKLHLRFEYIPNPDGEEGAGVEAHNMRLMVIHDTQTNGTSAAFADILSSVALPRQTVFSAPGNSVPEATLRFNEMSYINRFKILMDKNFVVQPSDVGGVTACTWNTFRLKKSFKLNLPIEYNVADSSGTLNNIRSNNIMVYLFSDKVRVTATEYGSAEWDETRFARVRCLARIRFADM